MSDLIIAARYRLDERLGTGSTAEVWAAMDLELDRLVALKLFPADADAVRFEREARAIAALAHPNICTVYDFGEAGDRPFIVLEYLPGGSLDERMTYGERVPDDVTERVAREVAAGLAHAHKRGVVHRDLKPANVLFGAAGHAKLADFGLARLGDSPSLTGAGTVLGTAAYIAPEQVAGLPATPATDVYSFGAMLFRMLTGRLPFEAEDAVTMASMHRDRPPPSLFDVRADAPARLESLVFATLAKSPYDRPQDGAALLAELGVGSRA